MVEIMVVLVLIAVLTGLVAIRLSSATEGAALRESASRLLLAARYGRSYAALHGCECRLTIAPRTGGYELTYRPDPDKDEFVPVLGGRGAPLPPPVRFGNIVIDSAAGDAEGQKVITFRPTGEADGAALELTDGRGVYSVLIAPHTGLVRLVRRPVREIPNDRQDLDA